MRDVFTQNNSLRGLEDRAQRIAFWVSIIGLIANTVLFVLYVVSDGYSVLLIANFIYYTVAISMITFSSYKNWHFRLVVSLGIAAIYVHMWGTAFYDAHMGNGSILSFPSLLFIPMCLVLVSSHRFLLVTAALQGAAVFVYTNTYLSAVYNLEVPAADTVNLAILLAVLSSLTMLVLAVVSFARGKTDTRLLGLVRETERLAAEDPLTGLKNRRSFMEELQRAWNDQIAFSVAFIDLDKFKPLNDQFGHAVGDAVLQVIGKRLANADSIASAARFGGDEFAVLIEDPEALIELEAGLLDLHDAITAPINVEVDSVSVGASLGFACAFEDAASLSELLHAADTTMMRCKANRLKVARFDQELDNASLASSAMEELFRKALSHGGIVSALQPIVSAKDQTVTGFELLARWQDSGLPRDPSPNEFILLAEKLGLLNELLWKTLGQAMPHLANSNSFLAINVSPSQLSSDSFVRDLKDVAKKYRFPLNRLEIEITEHVAFRNLDENIAILSELGVLGCKIVLDDFGAGYSSLSLLDTLPLDKVKLDKSLRDLDESTGVLSATIRLIKDLGFACCVEGVEHAELGSQATAKGCDYLQGYYFGYPEIIEDRTLISVAS